jgi:hypothetical protein
MTLPIEYIYSVANTRKFLKTLLDPKQTPRVPLAVRQQARACLKHYPWNEDVLREAVVTVHKEQQNAHKARRVSAKEASGASSSKRRK